MYINIIAILLVVVFFLEEIRIMRFKSRIKKLEHYINNYKITIDKYKNMYKDIKEVGDKEKL